jgi:translation elongation factor EF-Ts
MDSGDKATNKAMAIAMKYACFQVFCIPTEEMQDPDKESHQVQKKEEPEKPKDTNDKITEAQMKRLFTVAKGNVEKVKEVCGRHGYTSSKDILKKDYENIIKEIEK